MLFVCPICGGELTAAAENKTLKCPSGHSYDRARAGYYNLLIRQSGGAHGDNREMVEARRAFLMGGSYAPLRERIVATALASLGNSSTVLDIGAGEGYYTGAVARALSERDGAARVFAFDISKDAAKHLARACPEVTSAVASAYSMPVASETVDLALLVFSPLATEEILRVLKPHGRFIMVFPDKRHLFGLKALLYDTPYENKPEPTDIPGMRLISDEAVSYEITLTGKAEISSLFMMTPYAYRTSRAGRERLLAADSLTTELAFRILTYEKI